MVAMELVFLKIGSFRRTDCHGITARYYGGRKRQELEGRLMLSLLNKRILAFPGEYSIVGMLSFFEMDPTRDLLALAQSYKFNFDGKNHLGWSS